MPAASLGRKIDDALGASVRSRSQTGFLPYEVDGPGLSEQQKVQPASNRHNDRADSLTLAYPVSPPLRESGRKKG